MKSALISDSIVPVLDIAEPETVEVVIEQNGKIVWVNIEGLCRLRVCKIKFLELEDRRPRELQKFAEADRKLGLGGPKNV